MVFSSQFPKSDRTQLFDGQSSDSRVDRKRSDPDSPSLRTPPNAVLWEQLLTHVQSNHPTFGSQLVSHIATHLVASGGSDHSEDECLSGWLIWIVQKWGAKDSECEPEDVAFALMTQLSRTEFEDSSHNR